MDSAKLNVNHRQRHTIDFYVAKAVKKSVTNRDCHRAHWKTHKPVCLSFQNRQAELPDYFQNLQRSLQACVRENERFLNFAGNETLLSSPNYPKKGEPRLDTHSLVVNIIETCDALIEFAVDSARVVLLQELKERYKRVTGGNDEYERAMGVDQTSKKAVEKYVGKNIVGIMWIMILRGLVVNVHPLMSEQDVMDAKKRRPHHQSWEGEIEDSRVMLPEWSPQSAVSA
ncbi:hypothetical protein FRB96_009572 [Tulasnella sp. 330]|nr:hypothetical protein FRB96_009572 [Tulasnella sp. 330]